MQQGNEYVCFVNGRTDGEENEQEKEACVCMPGLRLPVIPWIRSEKISLACTLTGRK